MKIKGFIISYTLTYYMNEDDKSLSRSNHHGFSLQDKMKQEDLPWRAWGSWFSWGSPVGMGLFIISLGGFLVLLHLAGILH
jgi:hypothetical protein